MADDNGPGEGERVVEDQRNLWKVPATLGTMMGVFLVVVVIVLVVLFAF